MMHSDSLFFSIAFLLSKLSIVAAAEETSSPHNANHIFNAIHSSMRQWGSSLNHNGMSFFLATVPAGTQLYHGGPDAGPVEGLEWLAFEPEHALIFANPMAPRRPDDPPGDTLDEVHYDFGEDERKKEVDGGQWRFGHPHEHPPNSPRWDERRSSSPQYEKGPPCHEKYKQGPPPEYNKGLLPSPGCKEDASLRTLYHRQRPSLSNDKKGRPSVQKEAPNAHHDKWPTSPSHRNGPPPTGAQSGSPPSHRDELLLGPPEDRQYESHDDHNPLETHRQPLKAPENTNAKDDKPKHGYLHTFVPKRPLNLLYIDGMSGAKTQNGTLDSQDHLLLNWTSQPDSGMWGEYARAMRICNFTSTIWENKIDGVIRMEGGFEIMLCYFERDLEVRSVMTVVNNKWGEKGILGGWQYYKAVTERYHGIGGGRVELDYENFVSAYEYRGLDLWTNDVKSDVPMPRLRNAKADDLDNIRIAVKDMIVKRSTSDEEKEKKMNWQSIADFLITRYSSPLHQLHTSPTIRSSTEEFSTHIADLLRPFIDYTSRNTTLETTRCISQIVPPLPKRPNLAHKAIHHIALEICTTLLTILSLNSASLSRSLDPTNPPSSHALDLIDELVAYLQWTTWKQCPTCGDDEICLIPIWPMGLLGDHAAPKCRGKKEARNRFGYWGVWPPPKEEERREGGKKGLELVQELEL